jgi:hypothetical protein
VGQDKDLTNSNKNSKIESVRIEMTDSGQFILKEFSDFLADLSLRYV